MEFLKNYQIILVSTSGGKDSQAMLSALHSACVALGIQDRMIAVHADLGSVEWEGTHALAREQASRLGVRFEIVSRLGKIAEKGGKVYRQGETFGDLLDYVGRRGAWPDNKNRFCTSDFKRAPIRSFTTRIAREYRDQHPDHVGPVRVLDCQGLRAGESKSRAEKASFVNQRTSRNLVVDTYLPIKSWTEEQVWEEIKESGLPHHRAYDLGMTRLSCVFCVFAPKKALRIAGYENPDLLDRYVAVEEATGHLFRQDTSLAEVRASLNQKFLTLAKTRRVIKAILAG